MFCVFFNLKFHTSCYLMELIKVHHHGIFCTILFPFSSFVLISYIECLIFFNVDQYKIGIIKLEHVCNWFKKILLLFFMKSCNIHYCLVDHAIYLVDNFFSCIVFFLIALYYS
jgi:hypothetical protein